MIRNLAISLGLVVLYTALLMALQGVVVADSPWVAVAYGAAILLAAHGVATTLKDGEYRQWAAKLNRLPEHVEFKVLITLFYLGSVLGIAAVYVIETGSTTFLIADLAWPLVFIGASVILCVFIRWVTDRAQEPVRKLDGGLRQ